MEDFDYKYDAITAFKKKFEQKTHNLWDNRHKFKP